MRIVLTGATGHSGRWFVERLKKEHFKGELVCLVREEGEQAHLDDGVIQIKKVFGVIEGGFSQDAKGRRVTLPQGENKALREALKGADALVHIAGIQVSEVVIPLAIEAGVNWAIVVHTTGRYSKYKSASAEYIATEDKLLEQRAAFLEGKAAGMNLTIVRPTMIYGSQRDVNMHKLIVFLTKFKFFPVFGKGENLMQPVHARDLGNAYYDILIRPDSTKNKEYNLSGKEPLTYADIIGTTGRALVAAGVRKKENTLINIPFRLSVMAAKVYQGLFGKRAIINVEQVLRMQEDKDFSHEEAARDFGYDPIDFAKGIREEIEGMKKAGRI
ncbi:MAG: hypothetical protein RR131_06310 [Anaerovorax sp.]